MGKELSVVEEGKGYIHLLKTKSLSRISELVGKPETHIEECIKVAEVAEYPCLMFELVQAGESTLQFEAEVKADGYGPLWIISENEKEYPPQRSLQGAIVALLKTKFSTFNYERNSLDLVWHGSFRSDELEDGYLFSEEG